jgi:para-nitrobenzyl esterase
MAALLLPALLALALAPAQAQPIARAQCGLVEGRYLSVSSGRIAAWRGIRYAQPPQRWRAPVAPPCWSGVYNASFYRGQCVEGSGYGDEDCLFLHVFAPFNASTSGGTRGRRSHRPLLIRADLFAAPAPVNVYIHGGGLMDGSGEHRRWAASVPRQPTHAQVTTSTR